MNRRGVLLAAAVPPLALAGIAFGHPDQLTVEDAEHWKQMHIVLMPVFPLLALGPWLVARMVDPVASWVVAIPAYVYAVFYTALDIVGGVVAGAIKDAEAGGIGIVFPIAGDFEEIGGIAFVIASALGAGVALRGTKLIVGIVPAIVAVAASYILWKEHIFMPWGVVAGLMLAAGWGTLAYLVEPRSEVVESRNSRRQ